MTTVILTAGGDASRWGNYRGLPKHLIPIDGEPILHRAARLFAEGGATVRITGPCPHDPRYDTPHAVTYPVGKLEGFGECGMYQQTIGLWPREDRVVLGYGDVWYSEEAVRTILDPDQPRSWRIYARFGSSVCTGKSWGEVWAHSFWPEQQEEEKTLIRAVAHLASFGIIPRALIYEMYQLRAGKLLPWSEIQHDYGDYVAINDWTEDFDRPSELETWERLRRKVAA